MIAIVAIIAIFSVMVTSQSKTVNNITQTEVSLNENNLFGVTDTFHVREVKIALVGMTGSGKSSFIKTIFELLGIQMQNVEDLKSGPNTTGLTLKENLYCGEFTKGTVRTMVRMIDTALKMQL